MKKTGSLKLRIEPELLALANQAAESRHTTVAWLVRDFLRQLTDKGAQPAAAAPAVDEPAPDSELDPDWAEGWAGSTVRIGSVVQIHTRPGWLFTVTGWEESPRVGRMATLSVLRAGKDPSKAIARCVPDLLETTTTETTTR